MPLKPSSLLFTIMLAALSALPPLSIDMNLPAVPLIEADFGVEAGRGVLTLSLFLLGFSLAPIIGGPMADRFGRRNTLLVSIVINGVGAFGSSLAPAFGLLLASRMLQGAAAGVCLVVPLAIVRDAFDAQTGRLQLSRIMTVVGLAPLLAPMAGSAVLAVADWRAIYVAQGMFAIFLFLYVIFGLAETLPHDQRVALHPRQLTRSYKAILTNRTFLGFAIGFSFCFGCMFAYISGSPGVFIVGLGLTEQEFAWAFACTSAGLILGAWTSGRISKRDVSPTGIVITALGVMTLAALGVLAMTLTGNVHTYTLLPLVCVITFCFGVSSPSATHKAIEPLPQVAGSASGALSSMRMFVGSAASALVTFLGAYYPAATAMAVAMVICVVLALVIHVLLLRVGKAGEMEA